MPSLPIYRNSQSKLSLSTTFSSSSQKTPFPFHHPPAPFSKTQGTLLLYPTMNAPRTVQTLEESLTTHPTQSNIANINHLLTLYRMQISDLTNRLPPTTSAREFVRRFDEQLLRQVPAGVAGSNATTLRTQIQTSQLRQNLRQDTLAQSYTFREERREQLQGQIVGIQNKIDRLEEALGSIDKQQPARFRAVMNRFINVGRR